MKFFNRIKQAFTKKTKWDDLTAEQQINFTKNVMKSIRALSGARYKVVTGTDEWQRDKGVAETKNEDEILDSRKRGKLLDLSRNAFRNNPTFVTILKQFDLNAIGTNGGKAIITFKNEDFGKKVLREFSNWTRNADFFDGLSLNTLLKLVLKTQLIGGDLILLFDDGLISDSGKILLYEPDEIGDTDEKEIEKRYGKGSKQSLGRVYNSYGQFIGAIVSRSQRGSDKFDSKSCYFLKKDPNSTTFNDYWLMPRNVFRISQGRGISPTTSSLGNIIDLQDYVAYEIAAAKKNAQTLATVSETKEEEKEQPPSAFDEDTDFSNMSDEQIEQAVKAEMEEVPNKTVTLDRIKAAGCIYQVLPEGYKFDLLDTKHPNTNSAEWVKWLAAYSAAPFGLTSCYATLKCDSSYTAFRGEQLMAQPTFEEAQKALEQICDWILYRWSQWAVKKGIIQNLFEDDWVLDSVEWEWPILKDVDRVKEQQAIALQLKNNTGSYKEVYGSNWKEQLKQIAEEKEYMNSIGLVHPSEVTVSGAIVETNNEDNNE